MSANQIPRPGGAPTWHTPSSEHSCPDCWRHGGPGHDLVPTTDALPSWARPLATDNLSAAPPRRQCSYWSARQQEYCGDTDKVTLFPGVGHRCETHDPDLLNIQYRALVQPAEQAVARP